MIIIIKEHDYHGEQCARVLVLAYASDVVVVLVLLLVSRVECESGWVGRWQVGSGEETTNLAIAIFIVLRLFNINISA